jgi:hypothetical protein
MFQSMMRRRGRDGLGRVDYDRSRREFAANQPLPAIMVFPKVKRRAFVARHFLLIFPVDRTPQELAWGRSRLVGLIIRPHVG